MALATQIGLQRAGVGARVGQFPPGDRVQRPPVPLVVHEADQQREELPAVVLLGRLHVAPPAELVDAGGQEQDDLTRIGVAAEARGECQVGHVGGGEQRRPGAEAQARNRDRRALPGKPAQRGPDLGDLAPAEPEGRQALELWHEHQPVAPGEEPAETHEIGMATARRGQTVHEQERPARRTRPIKVCDETAAIRRHGRFLDAHLIEERREPGLGVWPHQRQRQAQRRAQPNEERDADQRRRDHRTEQPAPPPARGRWVHDAL